VRELYEAANIHEAQLLVHQLEERGIRTHVRNAHLHGALGELPLSVLPIVCITEPIRWRHAVGVLEQFLDALRAPACEDVRCPSCGETNPGNFEVCWKCSADLPGL
jgi:hypothetical protein